MNKILKYFRDSHLYYPDFTGGLKLFNILTDYYIDNNTIPSYPLFICLSVTSMCNGHCLFCSSNSRSFRAEEDIANPLLKRRLIELVNSTPPLVISLAGGEPLLFPNRCIEYLEVFKETNTIFSLLSNLSLDLIPERLQLMEILEARPLSFIQTSIDSINENEHEILRKGTNLYLILNNIKYLKRKNIKIKINATVSAYNYNNIMDVVRYAYNEGIESLHINHVLPFGRARGKVDSKLCYDIINSLIEVASSREFNSIKEHSITIPSESIPLSYIASKYKDILGVYNNIIKYKYFSSQFVCGLFHESNKCCAGWIPDIYVSIEDKRIDDAFCIARSKSKKYHNAMCNKCNQYNYCDFESFYTNSCLMLELYNKIDYILKYNVKAAYEESVRIKILNELKVRSKNICEVIISMTNECNGYCNFCQVEEIRNSRKDTKMHFDYKQIVNFLKGNSYHVVITGGEPLLRKYELAMLIRDLKKDGHIISLLTNLVLIDDLFIKTLQESFSILDVVQVSIYAHNPELHAIISGRDDWHKLNDVILQVINSDIQLRANLTLTNDNIEFIEDIYCFYKKLGVTHIAINGLLKKGRALQMVDEKYIYKYIYYMYKFIKENNPDQLSLSIPIEVLKTYSNIKNNFGYSIRNENLLFEEENKSVYIHYNGDVYSLLTGELICNINDCDLNNIVLPPITRDLSKSECANCHGYQLCKGKGDFDLLISKYGNLNYSYCDLD